MAFLSVLFGRTIIDAFYNKTSRALYRQLIIFTDNLLRCDVKKNVLTLVKELWNYGLNQFPYLKALIWFWKPLKGFVDLWRPSSVFRDIQNEIKIEVFMFLGSTIFYGHWNNFLFSFCSSFENLQTNHKIIYLTSIFKLITNSRISFSPGQLSTASCVFWDCKI